MRRLLPLTSAIVLVDTIFFAALSPLLPRYVERFALSKAGAGQLAGAFAVGVLLGAVPSGALTARLGVKTMALVGLGLLAATSLAFGLADHLGVLVTARFLGGIGSACSWTAAVSWLTAVAPRARRGELIGVTVSAAVAGALLGPVVGAAADRVGPGLAFGTVGVAGALLLGWVAVTPGVPPNPGPGRLLATLASPRIAPGLGLILLSPLLYSVLGVLVPLELARLGWGAVMIGALWVGTAALEAVIHPLFGRWADRRGVLEPVRTGLLVSAGTLALLAWADGPWALSALVIVAGLAFGATLVPGMTHVSHAADELGLEPAWSYGLTNLAWALGYAIGAPAGGALAQAFGDPAAYGALALVCLGTLAGLRWAPRAVRVP